MTKIISITEAQKTIGQIGKTITKKTYIITNHGRGSMVILPYFEGGMDWVGDYMEDYQLYKNKERLQKKYRDSLQSGKSSLTI